MFDSFLDPHCCSYFYLIFFIIVIVIVVALVLVVVIVIIFINITSVRSFLSRYCHGRVVTTNLSSLRSGCKNERQWSRWYFQVNFYYQQLLSMELNVHGIERTTWNWTYNVELNVHGVELTTWNWTCMELIIFIKRMSHEVWRLNCIIIQQIECKHWMDGWKEGGRNELYLIINKYQLYSLNKTKNKLWILVSY